MQDERVFLTVEQAVSCLKEGDNIHTFVQPNGAMLLGCDISRSGIIETLNANPDKIEIGGESCRSMGHGLIVWRNNEPMFIEADEEKLKEFDKPITQP